MSKITAVEKRIKRLCDKFYNDLQAEFDSSEMNDQVYDGPICSAAVQAQAYADEARHGEAA